MDITTEKNTISEPTKIAVYFRYPKEPRDKTIIQQRINAMASVAAADENGKLTSVYGDIGIPADEDNPFPEFERMQQDLKEGKFDLLLTEPPHRVYREVDAGLEYLLELRETGADIIFNNGQTMAEVLSLSIFRSTLKALSLVEAVAIQQLTILYGPNMGEGEPEDEVEMTEPAM